MNRYFMSAFLALTLSAGLLCAQKAPQAKSKSEVDGLMAIQNATTPDAKIKAVDEFLTKFADTEFKPRVLELAADSAERMGNYEKTVIYAERALEADPKSYVSMLQLSRGIASHTREHDLDKEEKLAKAEKYANDAIATAQAAPKPQPQIPDDQWASAKKDYEAQGHEALALSAMVRKKFDVAATEFKTALNMSAQPDPAVMVRLGVALTNAGKADEAIQVLEKVAATPGVNEQVKTIAQNELVRAKAAKK